MGIHIVKSYCNEQITAYAMENGRIISEAEADRDLWEDWQKTKPFGSLQRAQKKWKAMLSALRKLLYKLVNDGQMTQAEADAKLEQWLQENPEPSPDDNIDVTEEFQKPIPVYIPDRIELAEK